MLVVASTMPSAMPYRARARMKTASDGASTTSGSATAIIARPARKIQALSRLAARVSASTDPTPASNTIISRITDSVPEDSCHLCWKSGNLVVRLMKIIPWVAKPAAAAPRARLRIGSMGYIQSHRPMLHADPVQELWLVRHGATQWSATRRHTSVTDLPLLPEGERQARALRERL